MLWIHTAATINACHEERGTDQHRMDSMNKEYEPDWDQPALHSHVPEAAPKHQMAGAKQIVTIRLDVDMLEWFKAAGPGYQTRINQVLREHMAAQRAAEPLGE
ncbi:BrnA antitoxin family protein [Massilia niabensis]|uniref:BrnA antitoxin family protein n=1 Tax=Massilia niabensis TaxID=544910 RepID=A0ABW0KYN6_9BURK